jgi:hypothetical protein
MSLSPPWGSACCRKAKWMGALIGVGSRFGSESQAIDRGTRISDLRFRKPLDSLQEQMLTGRVLHKCCADKFLCLAGAL